VRIDVAGVEQRSIQGFNLDPGFSPDGYQVNERTTLRGPRDVMTFTSYELAGGNPMYLPKPFEYWVHYVIADAGNNRIVELIDRYEADPNTKAIQSVVSYADPSNPSQYIQALGVLYWHSPASFAGKTYAYNSIARTWVVDAVSGGRYVYAAGVGGSLPTRVNTGLDQPSGAGQLREDRSGNNGIVVFDEANSEVINEVSVPAIGANLLWDFTTNTFAAPAFGATQKTLTNVNSVTMRNIVDGTGATKLAIMFTDSTGVYEIVKNGATWEVVWMMPKIVYQVLRRNSATNVPLVDNPVDFRPTYARRLTSGEVLIVNGYVGFKRNATNFGMDQLKEFSGEVIQVDGAIDFTAINLGFNSMSVRFALPPTQGARGIVLPVFADRR
jgi:hypothetical protein